MSLQDFCSSMPKIELHAHLNTSFSKETLQGLIDKKKKVAGQNVAYHSVIIEHKGSGDLDEVFDMFKQIHKVCNDEDAIYTLTYDILHEFAADNVKYLELRSTPKTIPETGLTPELYLDSMIKAVRQCEKEGVDIIVRILPSIDRRNGVEVAYKTVDLAHKYMLETESLIPGIDFSGDPSVGDAKDYIPVFQQASKLGLKLALHLAEIASFEETIAVMQDVQVGRIGHGTFLHQTPSEHKNLEELVIKQTVPIEVCMTSNVKSKTVKDYKSHHLEFWRKKDHPIIICTDGKGVFQTTVSEEYLRAGEAFNLSREELWELSRASIQHIFANDDVKNCLMKKWESMKQSVNFDV